MLNIFCLLHYYKILFVVFKIVCYFQVEGLEPFSREFFGIINEDGGPPNTNMLRYSELGVYFLGRKTNDLTKMIKKWQRKYCKPQTNDSSNDPSRMGLRMFIASLVKRYKDDIFWDDPTRNLDAEEPGTAAVQELFPKMPRLLPYPKTQIYIKSEDGCLRPIKQEGKKTREKI